MKVAINIQADIQEIEVIINCMAEDENVQRIVSALDSLNTKLCCRRQGELFQIALNDILYIESVDRKTFIYTEQQIYETDKRLYELENHLKNRSFFRASKAVIINLKRTKSIRPEIGARLLLTMDNGEKVIVTSDSGFFLGGNVIAALVWCIIGVCFLIGYKAHREGHRARQNPSCRCPWQQAPVLRAGQGSLKNCAEGKAPFRWRAVHRSPLHAAGLSAASTARSKASSPADPFRTHGDP